MSGGGRAPRLFAAFALLCAARHAARAQACDTTSARTAPPSIEHAFINSVAVKTDAPIKLPFARSWLTSWRRRTLTSVVERQLLFHPGERVDTARVSETLRRLRDQRLYSDIMLTVRRCAAGDTVDLQLTTQDAWTLRPIARIVPPSTVSIGVEDRNLFGTGRSITVSNDQTARGSGGTFALTDPWLFGAPLIGAFRFSDIGGAHLLRSSMRNHELSVFDPVRAEIAFGRQSFTGAQDLPRPTRVSYLTGSVGHLVGSSTTAATLAYAGAERDEADVLSVQRGDSGTIHHHRRDFASLDLGLQRRTAVFDTVSWFAAGRGFLDVPLGMQWDVLGGLGADRQQHAAAVRYDAWIGRMWIPKRGMLFATDAWANGFAGSVHANHIDRLSAIGAMEAPGGFWAGRVLFEQLLQLDPDFRMLSLANANSDPSFSAVPLAMRLADRTLTSTAERSIHLHPIGRASMLDGALFAAGSLRWDSPTAASTRFAVAVVGARLRLFSANGSFGSTRLELAYPVAANASVVHRPLFSVSLSPILDAPRQRDGRRRQQ